MNSFSATGSVIRSARAGGEHQRLQVRIPAGQKREQRQRRQRRSRQRQGDAEEHAEVAQAVDPTGILQVAGQRHEELAHQERAR